MLYCVGVRVIRMGDILSKMGQIDDADAASLASTDHALEVALSMSRPQNWRGTGASQALLKIARDEGLPLSWVPRAETIKALDSAEDATARLAVLTAHRNEIITDCQVLLDECVANELTDTVALASRAVDATKNGHPEAGMALAVALAEPLAVWASRPRVTGFDSKKEQEDWEKLRNRRGAKYKHAQIEIDRLEPGDVGPWSFCYQVLIAPLPRFFTSYYPENGALPAGLSRHAVAHQPTLSHFSETNTLLSLMLVTSILRQMQQWIEEVGPDDV